MLAQPRFRATSAGASIRTRWSSLRATRDFLDRQLNETRYLSRTARSYLACLYDEKTERRQRVFAIPGFITALLRRAWGLEGMLRVTETR